MVRSDIYCMDRETILEVNDYLVQIFNEVLQIEEESLRQSEFSDLSIREMHTIEAIGLEGNRNQSDVVKALDVTKGTVSVAIQNLVSKGYVERVRHSGDRRITTLKLTPRGKLLFRLHRKFHLDMVGSTLDGMTPEEGKILLGGVRKLHGFLEEVKMSMKEGKE